jgi:hypothetical protein
MNLSRRQLIQSTALWSAGSTIPSFLTRTAIAALTQGQKSDRVLVILQLSGGNDGLNTIVPYADDEYGRNRTTLRLTPSEIYKIDDTIGFHYEMKAMWEQFQNENISVIQGVGYPKSNRDHAAALRDWHTAHPHDIHCQTGWLGRAADWQVDQTHCDIPCALVGNNRLPLSLNAERTIIPTIRSLEQLKYHFEQSNTATIKNDNPLLEYVKEQSSKAKTVSGKNSSRN